VRFRRVGARRRGSAQTAAVDAQDEPAKAAVPAPDGIFTGSFEQGEIGPDLFRHACTMGLEGLVSKRADRPYRAGRSKDWIKIKNRAHPSMDRVKEAFQAA
jgi:hypothetical protein